MVRGGVGRVTGFGLRWCRWGVGRRLDQGIEWWGGVMSVSCESGNILCSASYWCVSSR